MSAYARRRVMYHGRCRCRCDAPMQGPVPLQTYASFLNIQSESQKGHNTSFSPSANTDNISLCADRGSQEEYVRCAKRREGAAGAREEGRGHSIDGLRCFSDSTYSCVGAVLLTEKNRKKYSFRRPWKLVAEAGLGNSVVSNWKCHVKSKKPEVKSTSVLNVRT
jgi:hypothetical protein